MLGVMGGGHRSQALVQMVSMRAPEIGSSTTSNAIPPTVEVYSWPFRSRGDTWTVFDFVLAHAAAGANVALDGHIAYASLAIDGVAVQTFARATCIIQASCPIGFNYAARLEPGDHTVSLLFSTSLVSTSTTNYDSGDVTETSTVGNLTEYDDWSAAYYAPNITYWGVMRELFSTEQE